MTSLQENALLVSATIRAWSGTRRDKTISEKAARDAGAVRDAVRATVELVPKAALDPVTKAAGAVRAVLYRNTAPWTDGGLRLLPAESWDSFNAEFQEAKAEFTEQVKKFIARYPQDVVEASKRLGTAFDITAYPKVNTLRSKFDVDLDYMPVPSSAHIVTKLGDEALEKVRGAVEAQVSNRFALALGSVAVELSEQIAGLRSSLEKPNGRIYATVMDNIEVKAALLQRLNAGADPDVDQLCEQLIRNVDLAPEDLRNNVKHRENTARVLAKATDTLGDLFPNAFG